jgi:SSS family solute:Na+ symporter
VFISIGAAYLVMNFSNIIAYAQVIFVFFIVPLFATVILGMLWKRCTPAGAFWGLLAGILTAFFLWLWVRLNPQAVVYITGSPDAKDMSDNVFRAWWSLVATTAVTVLVSLFTKPKPLAELEGLVYGMTELPKAGDAPFFARPIVWAGVVAGMLVAINLWLW